MKHLSIMTLILSSLLISACTVEEERGTHEQLQIKTGLNPPVTSSNKNKSDERSPVDDAYSNVSSEKSGSKNPADEKMSEKSEKYEKPSSENENQENPQKQAQQRHQQVGQESLDISELTTYGMLLLMGQIMQLIQSEALLLGIRPDIPPEDCQITAAGTNNSSWEQFMRGVQKKLGLTNNNNNTDAENADLRSSSNSSSESSTAQINPDEPTDASGAQGSPFPPDSPTVKTSEAPPSSSPNSNAPEAPELVQES